MLLRLIAFGLALSTVASAGADSPVGREVASFELQDFRGKVHRLDDYRDRKLVVLAFLGVECPLAKRYAPRLEQLAGEFGPRGVAFLGVNSNVQDSLSEMAAYARAHGIGFPLLKDVANELADRVGAERAPSVFVLDERRVVRYAGRVDDQYGVGVARGEPQRHDLRTALEQLLADQPVSTPLTEAVGCVLGRVKTPQPDATTTYAEHVAPILQNRCVECHRDGEIGPFALDAYEEVVGWAEMIGEVVRQDRMPPWHASEEFGRFANERRLTAQEKETIYAWVDAGAPQGDPAKAPAPRTWVTGWQLPREPDFVAEISPTPYRVPADGEVRYQYFQVDPEFTEDKWVSAVEIQPGNRAVVHHVLMFAAAEDDVRSRFRGGAAGYDGVFVPGQRVEPYPPGMARRIAAGSHLVFQVHYTPVGSEQFDQSRVGMNFVDADSVKFEVRTASAVNPELRIPPHEADHRVEAASAKLRQPSRLLALNPHLHLRGKSFRYEAVLPGGERTTLLDVPRYDFNWQTSYRLAEPLELPAGTRMHCVAHFDNSAANPNNPDPTSAVRWGEQTWDEMMIGYFDYVVPVGTAVERSADRSQQQAQDLFDRLDRNADGVVTLDESPEQHRGLFATLDRDGDGALTLEELSRVLTLRRSGRR